MSEQSHMEAALAEVRREAAGRTRVLQAQIDHLELATHALELKLAQTADKLQTAIDEVRSWNMPTLREQP